MSFLTPQIRFGAVTAESIAGDPIHELTELSVVEVSLVDKPANNRPWVIKSVTENEDGVLVVDADSEAVAPVKAATLCEKAWNGLGALETALRSDPATSVVSKMLDVNEMARGHVFECMDEIGYRMDEVASLLSRAMGTPFEGSLDQAIGAELAAIGEKFMMLASKFGIMVPGMEPGEEGVESDVQKAGRAMSRDRMSKLAEGAAYGRHLAQLLATLLNEVGGHEGMMEEIEMGGHLMEARKSATDDSAADLVTKDHLDSRLAQIVDVMSGSHIALVERLERPVTVKLDGKTIASVTKSEDKSNRLESGSNQISGSAGIHNPFRPVTKSAETIETDKTRSNPATSTKSLSEFMAKNLPNMENR